MNKKKFYNITMTTEWQYFEFGVWNIVSQKEQDFLGNCWPSLSKVWKVKPIHVICATVQKYLLFDQKNLLGKLKVFQKPKLHLTLWQMWH